MKVRPSVKRICRNCKIIRRNGGESIQATRDSPCATIGMNEFLQSTFDDRIAVGGALGKPLFDIFETFAHSLELFAAKAVAQVGAGRAELGRRAVQHLGPRGVCRGSQRRDSIQRAHPYAQGPAELRSR